MCPGGEIQGASKHMQMGISYVVHQRVIFGLELKDENLAKGRAFLTRDSGMC